MKTLWMSRALILIDAVALLVLLLRAFYLNDSKAVVPYLSLLVVILGVAVALNGYIANLLRGRSEDIVKAATEFLDKVYNSLLTKEQTLSDHRLDWLTAARLLLTADDLAKNITEKSHKSIYREQKEYLRKRLYDLIFPNFPEGLPAAFYAEKPEHLLGGRLDLRAPISERSLALLYRFIEWPEGATDPLGAVPEFSAEEIERMVTFGPRGLGSLIAAERAIRAEAVPDDK